MIFSSLLLAIAAPVAGASVDDTQTAVCSEICVMQKHQSEIAELMAGERPAWAITLFRDMEDYIACGAQSFAKGKKISFEDFADIDRRFDRAAMDCGDERDALTLLAARDFLANGTFADSGTAVANIDPVRAMAFSFAMVEKFGTTDRNGAAEKYAEARLPELVEATRKRRAAKPTMPPPATYSIPAPPGPAATAPSAADRYVGWNPLKPDPFIADSPADVMKWELQGYPESLEGNQKLTMDIEKISGGLLAVTVVQDGLLDDSVSAKLTYAELSPRDDGKWEVTMKGEKWRCARSGSDDWVITPCP